MRSRSLFCPLLLLALSACGEMAAEDPVDSCVAPLRDCNGQAQDGCETDTTSDINHCGGCGRSCASVANATPTCVAGVCGVGACGAGFKDCDGSAANGCEANLRGDAKNCGACGKTCAAGQACAEGACVGCSPTGPVENLSVAALSACGWSRCHLSNFDDRFDASSLQKECGKAHVLAGCRLAGSDTLKLAAQAPRADVFFNTGDMTNTQHVANGTGWYFSANWSMGFAKAGDPITRSACDVNTTGAAHLRMCIHTQINYPHGYRCGTRTDLQGGDTSHERVFFHRD